MILILLGICGPLNQMQQAVPQAMANASQNVTPTPPNQTINAMPANMTQADLQVWNGINDSSVEQACLAQAESQAGSLAWAVEGCTCTETQGEGLKVYDCSISTLQGPVSAVITCILADTACNVVSPYGNGSMTFGQIYAELGPGNGS